MKNTEKDVAVLAIYFPLKLLTLVPMFLIVGGTNVVCSKLLSEKRWNQLIFSRTKKLDIEYITKNNIDNSKNYSETVSCFDMVKHPSYHAKELRRDFESSVVAEAAKTTSETVAKLVEKIIQHYIDYTKNNFAV